MKRRILFHWAFLVAAAILPGIEALFPHQRHLGELLRPIFIMAILGLGPASAGGGNYRSAPDRFHRSTRSYRCQRSIVSRIT